MYFEIISTRGCRLPLSAFKTGEGGGGSYARVPGGAFEPDDPARRTSQLSAPQPDPVL
jgi:hypothetical protein